MSSLLHELALHHELVSALGTHIAITADARADAPQDLPDFHFTTFTPVTGDDYW